MGSKITTSSTAEYFAKNLQQVGFSSPTKAVLTTLKESVDNALDACEEHSLLPEIKVSVQKVSKGSTKNVDLIEIMVEDNGPGLELEDITRVFGEYLASSKFGKGRCSRGQQGIGISAATTWAQLTYAAGVQVISKTKRMKKAVKAQVDVDIKKNKGVLKNKTTIDWNKPHGIKIVFRIDGRIQLNGDGGLITYLEGTSIVNPHLNLEYKLLDNELKKIERVTQEIPKVPPATLPHPHTMKLGEFIAHAHLYGGMSLKAFLKKGFSRVSDLVVKSFVQNGLSKSFLEKRLSSLNDKNHKDIFRAIQSTKMSNPSTQSVLTIGEERLSKSIQRLGNVDFFSVITRKPTICDHKPVVVEVAVARFSDSKKPQEESETITIQLLRFANRVPLQFDKSSCAITKSVESVNWKAYGLSQSKNSLPTGPYVLAVSVTSPFIKFKNASKETIDASEELVDEIRRTLMQAGQKLSRHIRREQKAQELERKMQYIESFVPILIKKLADITSASSTRVKKAEKGINKILGRDTKMAKEALKEAQGKLDHLKSKENGDKNLSDSTLVKNLKRSPQSKKKNVAVKQRKSS
ncbi:MAG: DNA topoisomerase VI subunit B [Bdellovibrionales bacterium]|nr:DNA topoisomerase VI subunit B [Bdellovibrionales bacterium]